MVWLPSEEQGCITSPPSLWLLGLAPAEEEGGKVGVQVPRGKLNSGPPSMGHMLVWAGGSSSHGVLHPDRSLRCVLGVQRTLVPVGGFGRVVPRLAAQHRRGHLGHTPTETFQSCQLKI